MYVHPLLDNSVIWSPPLKCDIEAIERVQRRFTKHLPGYHKHSYIVNDYGYYSYPASKLGVFRMI